MEIVCLLYPGMTALDLVGPHEVLSRIPGAVVRRVAEVPGPIETDSNLVLHAEHALGDVTRADILFVPGASDAWPVTRSHQPWRYSITAPVATVARYSPK